MSIHGVPEVLPACLIDPRLRSAWEQVGGGPLEPGGIEVLKRRGKSTVYRLGGNGGKRPALIAKRCLAATGALEHLVYVEILAALPLPSLRCHGMAREPDGEYCWLFLEDAGAETYSSDCEDHRELAGRWLGLLHGASPSETQRALLPERGPSYYLQLLRVARAPLLARLHHPGLSADEARTLWTLAGHLETAEEHWPQVEAFLLGRPCALVHGDFVARNLRVRADAGGTALLGVLPCHLEYASDAAGSFGKAERITGSPAFGVSIAVGSSGTPWVPFYSGGSLRVAQRTGGNWTAENVQSNAGPASDPATVTAIRVTSGSDPVVAYGDQGRTVVARRSGGTWTTEQVAGGGGYGISLALDGRANPHVAFYDVAGNARLARSSGGGPWETAELGATAPGPDGKSDARWSTGVGVDGEGQGRTRDQSKH